MWLNPQEIRIWSDLLTGEFLNRKTHFLRSVSYDIGKKFIAKIFYKFIVYFQKKNFFIQVLHILIKHLQSPITNLLVSTNKNLPKSQLDYRNINFRY